MRPGAGPQNTDIPPKSFLLGDNVGTEEQDGLAGPRDQDQVATDIRRESP